MKALRDTMTLCFLWAATAACDEDDRSPSSDRERYLASIDASPTQAVRLCLDIRNASLRGECVVESTQKMLATGDIAGASETCTALRVQPWKDECWFMVAEQSEDPIKACTKAGRFRLFCLGHQATDEILAATDLPVSKGDEAALEAAIRKRLSAGPNLGRQHTEKVVMATMARILAKRWSSSPFDVTDCGQAQPDVCIRAYSETMGKALEGVKMATICASPITRTSVVANGGQDWVDGSDASVKDAWKHLCRAWKN